MIKGMIEFTDGSQFDFECEDIGFSDAYIQLYQILKFEDDAIERPSQQKLWKAFPTYNVKGIHIFEYQGHTL